MTYEKLLSQAADALLVLEEHEETPADIRALCSIGRDAIINALIDAQLGRKDKAA